MNQSQSYRTIEEAQHQAAFGEHAGISNHCRFMINDIKNNSIHHDKLELLENYGEFSGLAWKLLGRYIANNTYLKNISLRCCGISDERMSLFFSELVGSESLHNVHLDRNEIGIEGLRNMLLFLRNSPQLKDLHLCGNYNLDTECFEFLVRTLCGTGVEVIINLQFTKSSTSLFEWQQYWKGGIYNIIQSTAARIGNFETSLFAKYGYGG